MSNEKEIVYAVYAENDDGTCDELKIDMRNKSYKYIEGVDKKGIRKGDDKNSKVYLISKEAFCGLFDCINDYYDGSEYREKDYEIWQREYKLWQAKQKKNPLIKKERVWQALKGELAEDELGKITSFDLRYEKAYYYDYDLIIKTNNEVMRGEISVSYFTTWCIVMMRCLMNYMLCNSKKLNAIFHDLGSLFDGIAFMDYDISDEDKIKKCKENLALFKYYNHQIADVINKKKTDFEKNGVITYVAFEAYSNESDDDISRVCIVDKELKTINYMYMYNIDFDEDIDYTIITAEEFNDLTSRYYEGYSLDDKMYADYQKTKKR